MKSFNPLSCKTVLFLLFAIMMEFSANAYDFSYDYNGKKLYFNKTSDATCELTYNWEDPYRDDIIIPDFTINENLTYTVSSIGQNAFSDCWFLRSIFIPNSIENIDKRAFDGCSSLTAFYGKYSSEDNRCLVTDGELHSFASSGLSSYSIPSSVTSIGESVFSGCIGLKSVEIPYSVTSIGKYAFSGCSGLKSIEIPNSVTSIGEFAFSSCWELTSIKIPSSITSIESGTFFCCYGLKYVELPNTLTSIGKQAFQGCSELVSVEIPISVTSVAPEAFCNCDKLSAYYGKYASDDNRCLIINGELSSFAPSGLSTYSIPISVTSIGESAFSCCYELISVEIPTSVTSIGKSAFFGCYGLISVEIPNSVISIEERAFESCSTLKSVNIPNTITSLGDFTFSGCEGLTYVDLPNSIISIGSAFSYCTGLISIKIPDSVISIGTGAFAGCYSLTSVEISNSVTSIGNNAFRYCSLLASLKINKDNPSDIILGSYVFDGDPLTTCTLYVPSGSKELYAAADQWKDFQNIEEFETRLTLVDGDPYTLAQNHTDTDVTYTRTFSNTNWQPLYVPFDMKYADWCDFADVAELVGALMYDDDNDGAVDRTVMSFQTVTGGDLAPNMPYLIRAKNIGEVTFASESCDIYATESAVYDCTTLRWRFVLHGTYQPLTDEVHAENAYVLSGGRFVHTNGTLNPYRFYLTMEKRDGGYWHAPEQNPYPEEIGITVDGEACSIEGLTIDSIDGDYYDLLGRKVQNPSAGIYIQNGQKVMIK